MFCIVSSMEDVEQQPAPAQGKIMAAKGDRRAPPPAPPREKMARCLAKMQSRRYDSWKDRVSSELLVVGTHVFDRCTPATYGEHYAIFSGLVCITITLAFAFMAGAYLNADQGKGPGSLHHYFVDNLSLNAEFLRRWGGNYGPSTRNQAYRLITYSLLHQNLLHYVGNLLIFGLVGFSLEHRYGTLPIVFVWLFTVVGAGLCVAIGRSCTVVVGLSSGIYGLFALFVADLVAHFRALRALALVVFIAFEIGGTLTAPNATTWIAHLSGLALGAPASLMFAHHLGKQWLDAALPFVFAGVVVTLTTALPIVAFHNRLPGLVC